MSDLSQAFEVIRLKQKNYKEYYDYYDGNQPLMYLASRLHSVFKGLDAYFAENWCAVVIDTCKERISFKRWEVENKKIQAVLDQVYELSELAIESDDVAEAMMVTGEGYLIAWPNENKEVETYYNDPRVCHVFYETENPRKARMAAKLWVTEDKKSTRMTLYYPNQIEYWIADGGEVDDANQFRLYTVEFKKGVVKNPYGRVPVFHFKLNKRGYSDLKNIVPLQNAVNKLINDMMVASEFSAFRQRWIISNAQVDGKLSSEPGAVWEIPGGDGFGQEAQVGEFAATDLKNYISSIERFASSMGVISRTPKHYFYRQGGDPSGEALIAMEAPLNRKVQDRIDRMIPVLKELAVFVAQVHGMQLSRQDVLPVFDRPETIQPYTDAQTIQTEVTSGIPLMTSLRWRGKTQAELKRVEKEIEENEARKARSLAEALLMQDRSFNSGNAGEIPDEKTK
jgi:hypothetical protein